MSALIEQAIAAAGLAPLLDARRTRAVTEPETALLRSVDLLALGAFADCVRSEEVGLEVFIHAGERPAGSQRGVPSVLLPLEGRELTGLELLREVAVARVTGTRGLRIGVDWGRCGLELAQVALGFGANELVGPVANKRGLPFADGELLGVGKKSRLEPAAVAKEKEIACLVRRAGRTPVFAGPRAAGTAEIPEEVL